jgi:hypothetical protein
MRIGRGAVVYETEYEGRRAAVKRLIMFEESKTLSGVFLLRTHTRSMLYAYVLHAKA